MCVVRAAPKLAKATTPTAMIATINYLSRGYLKNYYKVADKIIAMKYRINTMANVLIMIVLLSAFARAGSDLYLDGVALGNNLTPWVLDNTDAQVRRKHSERIILPRLFFGAPFRLNSNPQRIEIKKWVLKQPDRSITPDQLYKKAFEITDRKSVV